MSAFYLQKGNISALPITHYNMEMTVACRQAFKEINPDCIAVELPQTMEPELIAAAARLPDLSVIITYAKSTDPLCYLCEPCEPTFEGLRSALDAHIPSFCIDLDVEKYPELTEGFPDPYAIRRIGLKKYYESYQKISRPNLQIRIEQDRQRELYMAKNLKELSLRYDKVLFIGGMYHVERILELSDQPSFPDLEHAQREAVQLCTLTEESTREVMAEAGYITLHYEKWRDNPQSYSIPDRQKLLISLYKQAGKLYTTSTGHNFHKHHLRNTMKFVRNYALILGQLQPSLFQTLGAAKGCVDHNYAYEVWKLATEYPLLKNIDQLEKLDLSVEDIWRHSKLIRFHLKQKKPKATGFKKRKDTTQCRFEPATPFTLCSFPPEDLIIENFGTFLQKKGVDILQEESAHTLPFSSSLEDGIDTKETIRHWCEKTLYVKVKGTPPGAVGSVVVIFDEDFSDPESPTQERYPWKMSWLGEHSQESDMALYATPPTGKVVGPGISRCEYGGFMMSYPPQRMFDIWKDPDYEQIEKKSEILLAAAIDYAMQPIVVYVAALPPSSKIKSWAKQHDKKLVYLPIGQLSTPLLNKIRVFHVLDSHDRRNYADEYIF